MSATKRERERERRKRERERERERERGIHGHTLQNVRKRALKDA